MNSTAGSADTDGSRERRLIGLGICLLIAAACLWPRNATVLRDTNGGSNSLRAAPLGHAHDPHRVLDTGVVDRAAPSPPPLPPPPRGDGSLISSSSSSSGGGLAANRVDSGTLTAAAAVPETNKYGRGGVKMQLGLASADRSLHDQQTLPVVAPPSPPAEFEMLLRDLEHDFAVTFERQQVYNPTLALAPANTDDDKRYDGLVMYTRFEGRNSVGRWQSCPTDTLYESQACPVPDLRMISFVVTCKLSAHFSCSGPLRALSYPIDWPRAMTTLNERELGPEDPRAFVWHGELWLAYNAPPLGVISSSPRTIRCMQVQRVEPTLSKPVNLVMTSLSSGRTEEKEEEEEEEKKGVKMGRYEKNWSPIKAEEKEGDAAAGDNNSLLSSRGGKYLFSTGVEPHTVVACTKTGICQPRATSSSRTVILLKKHWGIRSLHLGTNAQQLPDGRFLGILHGVMPGQRRYLNIPYLLRGEAPWDIIDVWHKPLELPLGSVGHGFMFTSSLLLHGSDVIVSYNVNDRNSMFWRRPLDVLLEGMGGAWPLQDNAS